MMMNYLENIVGSAIAVPVFTLTDVFEAKLKPGAYWEAFLQLQFESELVCALS